MGGVPIYWLGGNKVADDYADFYDASWDSNIPRNERGAIAGAPTSLPGYPELSTPVVWTGTNDDGSIGDEFGVGVYFGSPISGGSRMR